MILILREGKTNFFLFLASLKTETDYSFILKQEKISNQFNESVIK